MMLSPVLLLQIQLKAQKENLRQLYILEKIVLAPTKGSQHLYNKCRYICKFKLNANEVFL